MNPTDEVSIATMFAEAKTLNEMKENTAAKYVNKKIRDYALAVLNNHEKVRKELIDTLAKNRYVLGKRKKLDVHLGLNSFSNDITFGTSNMRIRCHLINPQEYRFLSGYCSSGTIAVSTDNIDIDDIWWYAPSDNPAYEICSAWRLDNNPIIDDEDGKSRKITRYDIENGSFAEREWKQIYGLATWTEAYTKKMIEYFKDFIEDCVKNLRSSVNSDLSAKEKNDSVLNNGTHTTSVTIKWTL